MRTQSSSDRAGAAGGFTIVGLQSHLKSTEQSLPGKEKLASGPKPGGYAGLYKYDSGSLREAIHLAQEGEHAAFERIYSLYGRRVYAHCLRMVRDASEAEDLTQEAFLLLYRKIRSFRGESAFSSWLYRLTANLVLMHFRKNKRITTSLDQITASDEERALPREFGVPDLRLTGLIDRASLQAAIDQLPEGCRAAVILFDVLGFSHGEIAEMLGCSVGTSKGQLHRARKRLRKILGSVELYSAQQEKRAAFLRVPAGNY